MINGGGWDAGNRNSEVLTSGHADTGVATGRDLPVSREKWHRVREVADHGLLVANNRMGM